jgi:LPXTG-site transpeptidase (sortase) family protein
MYRRRQNPLRGCLILLMLGALLGWAFTLLNRTATPTSIPATAITLLTSPTPAPVLTATAQPTVSVPTLSVPTAGVIARIVDVYLNGTGWDVSQLGQNVGHLDGTASITETGNVILVGHVEMPDGSAGIFSRINQINPGDPIVLENGRGRKYYTVAEVRKVAPDDLSVLYPSQDDQLTLITCGDYNILQNTYLERIVVVAKHAA